jgi:hypothetical protein
MKTHQFLLGLVLSFLLISCEKINIGEKFIGRVGDKVRIRSNLSFSIRSVNDWRCPTDLICSSSGDVDISLRFHQGLHNTDTVICLYSHGRNPVDFGGYTIKLISVNPLPESDKTTPQEDFRIEMIVME